MCTVKGEVAGKDDDAHNCAAQDVDRRVHAHVHTGEPDPGSPEGRGEIDRKRNVSSQTLPASIGLRVGTGSNLHLPARNRLIR